MEIEGLKEKLVELFDELDVPVPLILSWSMHSTKRLLDKYEDVVRGIAMAQPLCECNTRDCNKPSFLVQEIDSIIAEYYLLRRLDV